MTMPRATSSTPPYPVDITASRAASTRFSVSEGPLNRREWIENRIQQLAEIFAVSVGGFSVVDRVSISIAASLASLNVLFNDGPGYADGVGLLFDQAGEHFVAADCIGVEWELLLVVSHDQIALALHFGQEKLGRLLSESAGARRRGSRLLERSDSR